MTDIILLSVVFWCVIFIGVFIKRGRELDVLVSGIIITLCVVIGIVKDSMQHIIFVPITKYECIRRQKVVIALYENEAIATNNVKIMEELGKKPIYLKNTINNNSNKILSSELVFDKE